MSKSGIIVANQSSLRHPGRFAIDHHKLRFLLIDQGPNPNWRAVMVPSIHAGNSQPSLWGISTVTAFMSTVSCVKGCSGKATGNGELPLTVASALSDFSLTTKTSTTCTSVSVAGVGDKLLSCGNLFPPASPLDDTSPTTRFSCTDATSHSNLALQTQEWVTPCY